MFSLNHCSHYKSACNGTEWMNEHSVYEFQKRRDRTTQTTATKLQTFPKWMQMLLNRIDSDEILRLLSHPKYMEHFHSVLLLTCSTDFASHSNAIERCVLRLYFCRYLRRFRCHRCRRLCSNWSLRDAYTQNERDTSINKPSLDDWSNATRTILGTCTYISFIQFVCYAVFRFLFGCRCCFFFFSWPAHKIYIDSFIFSSSHFVENVADSIHITLMCVCRRFSLFSFTCYFVAFFASVVFYGWYFGRISNAIFIRTLFPLPLPLYASSHCLHSVLNAIFWPSFGIACSLFFYWEPFNNSYKHNKKREKKMTNKYK